MMPTLTLRLCTLEDCCRLATAQLDTYKSLYHQSVQENGYGHEQTLFYRDLCGMAAKRVDFWLEHSPVSR